VLAGYSAWLAGRGRGNRCYREAAVAFLSRWPHPQHFAGQPLGRMLAADAHTRPFITFLLLHDLLRPGYNYLVALKFAGLVDLARGTRLEADLTGFTEAATALGFSAHVRARAAERVLTRLLIQTGRPMRQLTVADLTELGAAFTSRRRPRWQRG
jgi:hypothetical protein